ncbi:MAG: hypothetical protein WDA16_13305 [Candidatus Thermoplasmatota archaeon]
MSAAPATEHRPSFFNFRNSIVLLGVVITTIGLIYFAFAFEDIISQWGRVIDFLLLAIIYISMGLHFASMETSPELLHARGWRWLRTTTAFYLLGIFGGGATVIAFLNVDALNRAIKLLVVVTLGLALILIAATRFGKGHGAAEQ